SLVQSIGTSLPDDYAITAKNARDTPCGRAIALLSIPFAIRAAAYTMPDFPRWTASSARDVLSIAFVTNAVRVEVAMCENETAGGTAVADEEAFQYQIKIEDAGPATKKVSVEIPED